jgi:hypothetical protein
MPVQSALPQEQPSPARNAAWPHLGRYLQLFAACEPEGVCLLSVDRLHRRKVLALEQRPSARTFKKIALRSLRLLQGRMPRRCLPTSATKTFKKVHCQGLCRAGAHPRLPAAEGPPRGGHVSPGHQAWEHPVAPFHQQLDPYRLWLRSGQRCEPADCLLSTLLFDVYDRCNMCIGWGLACVGHVSRLANDGTPCTCAHEFGALSSFMWTPSSMGAVSLQGTQRVVLPVILVPTVIGKGHPPAVG